MLYNNLTTILHIQNNKQSPWQIVEQTKNFVLLLATAADSSTMTTTYVDQRNIYVNM